MNTPLLLGIILGSLTMLIALLGTGRFPALGLGEFIGFIFTMLVVWVILVGFFTALLSLLFASYSLVGGT